MNEEQDPVELLLARMKPASMNNDLMARLTAARSSVVPEPKRVASIFTRIFAPLATVACVAVATVFFLNKGGEAGDGASVATTTPGQKKQLPVVVQDHLMQARDMGVMVGPNQQPYRVMEYQWVESDTVVPEKGGPAVRLETTRRQLVPVQIEIY